MFLTAFPAIVSHNISIDPENLLPGGDHKIMCNVEVNPADSMGNFFWKINGFELRLTRAVQPCQNTPCASPLCSCIYIDNVQSVHSGKSISSFPLL